MAAGLLVKLQLLTFKFPKEEWGRRHLQMVLFGRYYCKAIKPNCSECKLIDICSEKKKIIKKEIHWISFFIGFYIFNHYGFVVGSSLLDGVSGSSGSGFGLGFSAI